MSTPLVATGADRLLGRPELRRLVAGRRVGLLVNHTAVTRDYRFWPAGLRELTGARLEVIFSPEHGLWGEEQDQAPCPGGGDPGLGVPVVSLYGGDAASLRPDPARLAGLELVLYDIQDVGSRYYTFVYSLAFLMEAAAGAGVRVVVLDRPNPLGGELVEGPTLQPGYESFVGRFAGLPVRHGLTTGELARWFSRVHGAGEEPEVVRLEGWDRRHTALEGGWPWVPPSPNMPTPETALVYPGMCLLEGTNLSEGRGTTRPFEIIGAPWLDPFETARALNGLELPGVRFRPHRFRPTFHKWAGELCGGVQLHVLDRAAFRPFLTGAALLLTVAGLAPERFGWRQGGYEFIAEIPAIDLLSGGPELRGLVEGGGSTAELERLCRRGTAEFIAQRGEYLLY